MTGKAWQGFSEHTASWFAKTIGEPTAVQQAAWPAIASGHHTLVSAPTGTGKTLAAFLVLIDTLHEQARKGTLIDGLQVIYVSPLKSLAADIRENLRRPLDGLGAWGAGTDLRVAIRTGDTTTAERRRMIKSPPHILITTPESLYLLLTAKSGQGMLATARWLVIDELHALIDTKRGAHLMLSIARLDQLIGTPMQRIGLSATIEPLSLAASYLAPEPVVIAAPPMTKEMRLEIIYAQPDALSQDKDPVWRQIARTLYERCQGLRSAIAFGEGRAYVEKLAYYVNELGGDGFARTHHGSLSKERRQEVESDLRAGRLRLLCATSSMELGIDVGEIDRVFQVGCPRTVSSLLQRLGRAGHRPDQVSEMELFPRASVEALYCGLAAETARRGGVEPARPPEGCLDVLAQHLVSMAATTSYTVEQVLALLPRAYPFRKVSGDEVRRVLRMLAGDDEHTRDIPARARVLYDRLHDRVEGDAYSKMLAISAAGTIPDKGLFTLRSAQGVKLGELDEEFVFEARVGDKFLLGSFAWRIAEIGRDTVVVEPGSPSGARAPFWKGEIRGRSMQTGIAYGKILADLNEAHQRADLSAALQRLGLDDAAVTHAAGFIKRQTAAAGMLPDDRTMLVEHYKDETGIHQMAVHAVFGRQVNEPLALLAAETARRISGMNINAVADDDGFLLFPYDDRPLPEDLLRVIDGRTAREVLAALLPATPLFNMNFRYNAARALMMGVRMNRRQPLWVQRLRSTQMLESLVRDADHPLMQETRRECMEHYWDLSGLQQVLEGISIGMIRVVEQRVEVPSPLSLPLRRQTEGSMMYDYAPTTPGVHAAVTEAAMEQQSPASGIDPGTGALAEAHKRLRLPESPAELHALLMREGDLVAGEIDVPIQWLEQLVKEERVTYIEPGLWIAREHDAEYIAVLDDNGDVVADATAGQSEDEGRARIVLRLLRHRGPHSIDQLATRYVWSRATAEQVLTRLVADGKSIARNGQYVHAALYERAQRTVVQQQRQQVRTLPGERFAALLASRAIAGAHTVGTPEERLASAIEQLVGNAYAPSLWEQALLPLRMHGYQPAQLDALLAQGIYGWQMVPQQGLRFVRDEEIDWSAAPVNVAVVTADAAEAEDADPTKWQPDDDDIAVMDALEQRGAAFVQRLSGLTERPVHEVLLGLAERGMVTADSFVPIRQIVATGRQARNAGTLRQQIRGRVQTLLAGRWDRVRPLLPLNMEAQLERAFTRSVVLCRETAQGLDWGEALAVLRIWEYTGRVRRGYFVAGLSGIQFIREQEYVAVCHEMERKHEEAIWLSALDPALAWGRYLPHQSARAFTMVAGTAVALWDGRVAAVLERKGRSLRVFEQDVAVIEAVCAALARAYNQRRLYPELKRIMLKEYPETVREVLGAAGFRRDMQDMVLDRGFQ